MSKPAKDLYFLYGSALNAQELKRSCPTAEVLAVAELADHKLGFYGHSDRWDGAQESVAAAPGRSVFGIVCAIPPSASDRLDKVQGVKLNGTGSYFHTVETVVAEDGTAYQALLYRKAELGSERMPSREYLDHLVIGALWHQLPAAYIDALKGTETRRARYPVPREEAGEWQTGLAACAC